MTGVGRGQVTTLPGGAAELTAVQIRAVDGTLFCTLTARTAEGSPREKDLAIWGQKVLTAALASGWDCWGLERKLGGLRPGDWEVWENYPVERLAVNVTGKLVKP